MRKLLFSQLILALFVAAGSAWPGGVQGAVAALFGGAVAMTNTALLAWRAARMARRPTDTPHRDLRQMYFAALERFAIVAMLLAAGLGALHLEPGPLLAAFIAGQLLHMFSSLKSGFSTHVE
ncbi:ATP synthase subunit I [Thiohalobacter sp.]|uniref:ATP synthase subunit I n=1 Tax=Thiohalobacter sp. TaxID=2025948 RepID=UPI0026386B1F|nr:ATP synthase subunit I [Thiohalobacter sp.]